MNDRMDCFNIYPKKKDIEDLDDMKCFKKPVTIKINQVDLLMKEKWK